MHGRSTDSEASGKRTVPKLKHRVMSGFGAAEGWTQNTKCQLQPPLYNFHHFAAQAISCVSPSLEQAGVAVPTGQFFCVRSEVCGSARNVQSSVASPCTGKRERQPDSGREESNSTSMAPVRLVREAELAEGQRVLKVRSVFVMPLTPRLSSMIASSCSDATADALWGSMTGKVKINSVSEPQRL